MGPGLDQTNDPWICSQPLLLIALQGQVIRNSVGLIGMNIGLISVNCAASLLPGKGPTHVNDTPAPAY